MSFNLTVKNIPTNDYQQIFIADVPTNIFINRQGNLVTKSITEDVISGNISLKTEGSIKIEPKPDSFITLGGATGFEQQTITYDASNTTVDFRDGNKAYLELTGNIANLNMTFPKVSGNFVILIKQDSSTRTISDYKVFDHLGNAATETDMKFPANTAPDLTNGNNRVDILSIYWDATNGCAYGIASLDFY